MMEALISACFRRTGSLPSHTRIGEYPLMYIDGDNRTICPECATRAMRGGPVVNQPVDQTVNWEDMDVYCEQCGRRIASAYEQNIVELYSEEVRA